VATEINIGADFTLPAAADYHAKQFYLVKINSSGQALLCSAGTDPCCGVLQNEPAAAGRGAQIRPNGITKVVYGGTVTAGDLLSAKSDGTAQKAASGDYVIGIARVSGASGDTGSMLLTNAGRTS
jgi:Uncharacterized conserved protein (DUF2190)